MRDVETAIIVHIEPQGYRQTDFNKRIFQYYSLLCNKLSKPIVPIAVFSYEENRSEKEGFVVAFPDLHVLTFRFKKLELRKKNWREYIKSDNPVAAALLSKMDYTEKEKVQVKLAFWQLAKTLLFQM